MFRLRENPELESPYHVNCPSCHGKGIRLVIVQKTEPCITCNGTGYSHNARCFVCGGIGVTPVTHTQIKDCEICDGTGQVQDRHPAYA